MLSKLYWQGITLLLLLISTLFIGCTKKQSAQVRQPEWGNVIANPTLEENKKNWELWKSKALQHYRYKTKITCDDCTLVTYNKKLVEFDRRVARGASWVIVEVNNSEVLSVKNIDGSDNPDFLERLAIYKADVISKAFEGLEDDVQYEFNPRVAIYDSYYGFPRYYEILPSDKGPTDIGHRIEIIEFEVLPAIKDEAKQE